jgi:hypothetical protein
VKALRSKTRLLLALGAAAFALGVLCLVQAEVRAADFPARGAKMRLTVGAGFGQGAKRAAVPPAVRSQRQRDLFIRRILPMMGSTKAQLTIARNMGMKKFMGKTLPGRPAPNTSRSARLTNGIDTNVTGDFYGWYGSQNEPSVAVGALNPDVVVAFSHNDWNISGYSNACSVYLSFDGGQTFYYDSDVPLADPTNFCSDPVVRFSPDGLYVYLSYMDINSTATADTVNVQVRSGQFPYSVGPTQVVFTGTGGAFVDKPWIDVHTWDQYSGQGYSGFNAPYIYATATVFDIDGSCSILLNRSSGYGLAAWDGGSTGIYLFSSLACSGTPEQTRLVQGSRPAGGPGSQALVCFYDAGADGWSPGGIAVGNPPHLINNKFNIVCVESLDNFDTTLGWFYASLNIPYDSAYWMGPNAGYFRISAGGFPALAIDNLNNVHLAYGHDPNTNPNDPEAGNIFYQRSIYKATTNPYWLKWTGRSNQGAGAGAQLFPAVTTQAAWDNPNKPYVWLTYYDTKRSYALGAANRNSTYDVSMRVSINGGAAFKAPQRINDAASLSDYVFIGDYLDGSADRRNYHVVWTDRADAISIYAYEDDVFHDRFAPPGSN